MDLLKIKVGQIQQGWSHQQEILTILPLTSDSISLKSFMASITQRTDPSDTVSPTSTKTGLSGAGFL